MRGLISNLVRKHLRISAHPYEGVPLLLVSGVGRSGTTVVRHSLGAHPDVDSTGVENNIIFDVLETAQQNCTYPSRRATLRVAPPAYDRQFRLLLLNLLWPEPRTAGARPRMLLATSDLTPARADYLLQLFPDARIVYVVRNGIEVVASRSTHPQFRDASFEEHCRAWSQSREMVEWGREKAGFMLLRQETLLEADAARAALSAALLTLGLTADARCTEIVLGRQFHPTHVVGEAQTEADDLRRRQERWKFWSDEQREAFSSMCGPAMRYFGYPMPWSDQAPDTEIHT